ncbi:centrosomal protein CCDC61 [Discoglossus pictus]
MEATEGTEARCVFRGIEHVLRVRDAGDRLEVEVEDAVTTDQWRGEFDAEFIEDLTHKTGNFKQYSIFCNMLHSALTQSSESVTLDLLTYADLELLRHRKAGGTSRQPPPPRSSALNTKRYLILIYSVEFDRIHYPLPLPYVGKPDPVYLRQVIRGLKEEVTALRAAPGESASDVRRLREELQILREEKQEMELTLQRLQDTEIPNSKETSQIRILKRAVQTLEAELQKERIRSQRAATKKREEGRLLAEQLEEARAAERTLRLKVKSLTTELAMYKRGRVTPTGPSPSGRSGSACRAPQSRSGSRGDGVGGRDRSASRERNGRSSGDARTVSRQPRMSPSPVCLRPPRFDPTAYVKDRVRHQKEVELKKVRRVSGSPSSMRGQKRSSSVESLRSHRSCQSSGDEFEDTEPLSSSIDRRVTPRGRKPFTVSSWNSHNKGVQGPRDRSKGKKRLSSTPTNTRKTEKENRYDNISDLSDIDARLQALQDYMRNLDTR